MPRPPKCRRVEFEPEYTYFKPTEGPKKEIEEIILSVEEVEAIRLKDRKGLEQEDCAVRMNVSRPTFQRILIAARTKIAEAIIEGKAIKIAGGNYSLVNKSKKCPYCSFKSDKSANQEENNEDCIECVLYSSDE